MNISQDPALNGTGRLTAASPCRDTGTATGAPNHDIDNEAPPNNGRFDIGGDEFVP